VVLAFRPVRLAVKGAGTVNGWDGVELGYGPPLVVPYWKDTFTVPELPRFVSTPFSTAELDVMEVAFSVATAGGSPRVVKLFSLPYPMPDDPPSPIATK